MGGAAVDGGRDVAGPEDDGGEIGPECLGRVAAAVELFALPQLPAVVKPPVELKQRPESGWWAGKVGKR